MEVAEKVLCGYRPLHRQGEIVQLLQPTEKEEEEWAHEHWEQSTVGLFELRQDHHNYLSNVQTNHTLVSMNLSLTRTEGLSLPALHLVGLN